jgi:aminopeptidase N
MFVCLFPLGMGHVKAQESVPDIDVLHYQATLEPDIANKTVKGSVAIRFITHRRGLGVVEFDCGELVIDSVKQNGEARQFSVEKRRVKIVLPPNSRPRQLRQVQIEYHGSPKRGIRFFPDREQVYTIFSTSQWMVCVDAPEDRATFNLRLVVPAHLTTVGNGRLKAFPSLTDKLIVNEWEQKSPIPTYIFGFAVGPFKKFTTKKDRVEFQYLVTGYSEEEVGRIFRNTLDMFQFFTGRAGVSYADGTYAQVLAAGGVEQEMSSFTALPEAYGKRLLENEKDVWLGAHEMAHQWWGNMVTCRDWNHFWLNEGIATFMAAAYIEHRFGRAAYMKEIDGYRESYEKVKAAGKDKSLVFPDWLSPTREDRTLVYDKGAYVMHLLREEMGEQAFWNGLRVFTRRNFGKSVVTNDFTQTMQESTRKNLGNFFARWIFNRAG